MAERAREYWIYFNRGRYDVLSSNPNDPKYCHVIEYSAVQSTIKERDQARAELAKWQSPVQRPQMITNALLAKNKY